MVYIVALMVLTAVCVVGVLNREYRDTLQQRCAMVLVIFAAPAEIFAALMGEHNQNAQTQMAIGVAWYAVGTLLKVRAQLRERRPQRLKNLKDSQLC